MPQPIDLLPTSTAMGAVTLRVRDLDLMGRYYQDAVRLELLGVEGDRVVLGRAGVPVVVLESAPELRHAGDHEAGLFHAAILFDTEQELAATAYSIMVAAPGSFTGSANHVVSNAFYFRDPEGNGLELYWDRDRSAWTWAHGRIEMNTLHLDAEAYLRQHLTEEAVGRTTTQSARVGHVHLSVGDIAAANDFYVEKLGFETTWTDDRSSLFVSAGKYHHHMAMNTWKSRGAGRRGKSLGLGLVRIGLPDADSIGALEDRLSSQRVPVASDGRTLFFEDPWANRIETTVLGAGPVEQLPA